MDVRSGGENIRRKTGPSEIRTAGKAKGPRTHVWAPVSASGWAVAIVRHGPVVVIHARHGALRLTNPNFRTSSKPDCQTACGLHLLSYQCSINIVTNRRLNRCSCTLVSSMKSPISYVYNTCLTFLFVIGCYTLLNIHEKILSHLHKKLQYLHR